MRLCMTAYQVVFILYLGQNSSPKSPLTHATTSLGQWSAAFSRRMARYLVPSKDREHAYLISEPRTDLDAYVPLNAFHVLFSLISLLLATTDIPRSDTGIRTLQGWLTAFMPDTAVYFGPFAFHTAQILRVPVANPTTVGWPLAYSYNGSLDGVAINSTALWSYKYDTLSVPQRALAQWLNVSSYPPCLLYKQECLSQNISLQTTFLMLDGLVNAIDTRYFSGCPPGRIPQPIVYRTVSYWVDRVHHYIMQLLGHKRSESRVHAVYFYRIARGQTLNVCDWSLRKSQRPFFCDLPIKWTCPTLEGADIARSSSARISIAVHLMVRLAQLQRQHPLLHFDVTLFTSQVVSSNIDQRLPLATSLIHVQKNGITTLIRGRSCPAAAAECETVLLDDYRYECEKLMTDVTHWFWITSCTRVVSQGYIWARILLLWFGCFRARSSEPKYRGSSLCTRVWCACSTFLMVPSQIIIYSSWMPALGYAFAYFIDCNFYHQHIDEVFSSVNGVYSFDLWTFLQVACVQMRNIWFIALVVKCLALVEVHLLAPRSDPWRSSHGLSSYQSQAIGCLSALTIFAPMRRLEFRTSDVTFFEMLPASVIVRLNGMPAVSDSIVEFGLRFDLKAIVESCFLLVSGLIVVKLLIGAFDVLAYGSKANRLSAIEPMHLVYSRSHGLPLSLGTLTSHAAMSFAWDSGLFVPTTRKPGRLHRLAAPRPRMGSNRSNWKVAAGFAGIESVIDAANSDMSSTEDPSGATVLVVKSIAHPATSSKHEPPVQTARQRYLHSNGFTYQVELRTIEVWSMVRLVNLALLTDPLTLFGIYVTGRSLFIYRPTDGATNEVFLLPCPLDQLQSDALGNGYDLVDTVDSVDVPWSLLLQCG